MVTTHKHKRLVWVDIESPSKDEIKDVMKKYDIHPDVAEELLSPSLKPKVDVYKDFIYLILHFPALRHTHSNEQNQEVDFIITKNVLITTRYDTVDSIHKFSKEFEVDSILKKKVLGTHASMLFFLLIKKLYRSLVHELEYIESSIEKIEKKIFSGHEREMVRAISEISRDLLSIEQTIRNHKSVLDSFNDAGAVVFGERFSLHLQMVIAEYERVRAMLKNSRDFLGELRETNNSLVSTKQNEVMKVLTIMAFVTFPLSLIASIFGMNTEYLPLVGMPGDFWIIIGIMATLTTVFFVFFKYKKWL